SNVVYTATATDPDTVGSVVFSITGTDSALFDIDGATGEVTFKSSPDHENRKNTRLNNSHEAIAHADDGVHDKTKAVAITVTDTYAVASTIASCTASLHDALPIFSNVVYTATATDPDTVGSVVFSITGTDSALFDIDGATGEVTFKSSPDH